MIQIWVGQADKNFQGRTKTLTHACAEKFYPRIAKSFWGEIFS